MIVKKCDRCGKCYDEYNTTNNAKKINGLAFLNIDNKQRYYTHGPYDLCASCSTELIKWFNNERTENHGQST